MKKMIKSLKKMTKKSTLKLTLVGVFGTGGVDLVEQD